MKKKFTPVFLASLLLLGCATVGSQSKVVPIGLDKYSIGGNLYSSSYASSDTRATFFQEAARYCADRTRVMQPIDTSSLENRVGDSGRVELQFYCLLDSDPRLKK
jgi:hypothetical protein